MDQVLNQLSTIADGASLEAFITNYETLPVSYSDNEKLAFLEKLASFSDNAAIVSNAKIRRRAKRFMQNVQDRVYFASIESVENIVSTEKNMSSLEQLRNANDVTCVQRFMDSFVIPQDKSPQFVAEWEKVKCELERILKVQNLTNKNLRRRITRLIYVLSSDDQKAKILETSKQAKANSVAKVKAKQPIVAEKPSNVVDNKFKSFITFYEELNKVKSSHDIDVALNDVSIDSKGDLKMKIKVLALLKELVLNIELVDNAKLRRRMKRFMDTLSVHIEQEQKQDTKKIDELSNDEISKKLSFTEPETWNSSDVVEASNKINSSVVTTTNNSNNDTNSTSLAFLDVNTLVNTINKCTSAPELEDSLINIKSSEVIVESKRNHVKDTILHKMNEEDIVSGINAKIRRRLIRVLKFLDPEYEYNSGGTTSNSNSNATTNKQAVRIIDDNENNYNNHGNFGDNDNNNVNNINNNNIAKHVPYIVFIGQLSYTTTESDIEHHLRHHGHIEGNIKVRLLTDATTKKSKGMAFVEVDTAKELHQCIALHHSKLHNRIINIEKSCGGKNKDTRQSKLQTKRHEQSSKVHETLDQILQEYEQKGILLRSQIGQEFKEKIYKLSSSFVSEAMRVYATYPSHERKLSQLVHLLEVKDEKSLKHMTYNNNNSSNNHHSNNKRPFDSSSPIQHHSSRKHIASEENSSANYSQHKKTKHQ